jgi:hypothetical protein
VTEDVGEGDVDAVEVAETVAERLALPVAGAVPLGEAVAVTVALPLAVTVAEVLGLDDIDAEAVEEADGDPDGEAEVEGVEVTEGEPVGEADEVSDAVGEGEGDVSIQKLAPPKEVRPCGHTVQLGEPADAEKDLSKQGEQLGKVPLEKNPALQGMQINTEEREVPRAVPAGQTGEHLRTALLPESVRYRLPEVSAAMPLGVLKLELRPIPSANPALREARPAIVLTTPKGDICLTVFPSVAYKKPRELIVRPQSPSENCAEVPTPSAIAEMPSPQRVETLQVGPRRSIFLTTLFPWSATYTTAPLGSATTAAG